MHTDAIQTSGLCKRFGRREVLKGVELSVPAGSIFGLLGRNGAGKSTLIKAMLGLLKFEAGQCRVLGLDVKADPVGIRARVGYMAENQTMYAWMSVRQIIDWVGRFYAVWDKSLAAELQGQFGLDDLQKVGHLSKGQTSKLALLLALAHRPELVVLDDPTLGLDPIARKDFLREVIGQLQQRGITVFFSSHLLYEIEPICDRIGILDDGRIIRVGVTDALREQVKRVIVSVPELPMSPLAIPGLLDVQLHGRAAAIVTDDLPGTRSALANASLNHAEVEDLNLDEIFEAYVIGRRSGGPFSLGQTAEAAAS